MVTSLVAFVIAGVVAFLITPPIRRLAERLQVIDKPDRQRKRHRRLIPLWGGLAIFIAVILGVWLALEFTAGGQVLLTYREGFFGRRLPFVFSAFLLLLVIGLLDDRKPLPPKVKLLAQIIAAGVVVMTGFRLEAIMIPFLEDVFILWKAFGMVAAVLWLIFMINSFNFIDGLDGLASGQAVLIGSALAIGALILTGHTQNLVTRYQYTLAAVLSAAAAGAALGFWRFNHFPAKIFLGDAGANVLGFILSFSALLLWGRTASAWTPLFVLLIFAWPILDTIQVVIRRLRRGEPISKADNRHMHHFLLQQGFTASSAVAFINMIVLILCCMGLVITWL